MKKNDLTTEIPVKDRHGNVVGQKTVVRFSGLVSLETFLGEETEEVASLRVGH